MHSKKVTLFIPCLIDRLYPEVGEAVVTVLERLGIHIDCPMDQTCCGQPAFNVGHRREARAAAKRFIRIFESADTIVSPSGSCVHMIRHHYPVLFRDHGQWYERARKVGVKTFEFSEYLVDIVGLEKIEAFYEGSVTYHDACHLLRGLGIEEQPRQLIRRVKGIEFVEMKDASRCCGFGGAFSIQYPEISTAMLEDKVNNILDSGADAVVGGDMGCLMNIEGLLRRRNLSIKIMHIAQLLAYPDGGKERAAIENR